MKPKMFLFRYTVAEIVSAQRSRFLATPKVLVIFGFGLLSALVVLALDYTVGIPRERPPVEPWVTGSGIAGIFMTVFLLLYLIAPHIDARFNRHWKPDFYFGIDPEFLYFGRGSDDHAYKVQWFRISKVLDSRLVYVLFLGSAFEFLVVPKTALRLAGLSEEFHEQLITRKPNP